MVIKIDDIDLQETLGFVWHVAAALGDGSNSRRRSRSMWCAKRSFRLAALARLLVARLEPVLVAG